MKLKTTHATYESPQTTLFNLSTEGVLCASTQKFEWDEENVLDDLAGGFGDWSN